MSRPSTILFLAAFAGAVLTLGYGVLVVVGHVVGGGL